MASLNKKSKDCHCSGCESHLGICLEKGLSASLESFDKLFCRRCLVNSKRYSLTFLSLISMVSNVI